MIDAHGLRRSFDGREVLRGVDLLVPEGAVFCLLGPNGAGKTTLIRILATLLRPDGGQATIAGLDLMRSARAIRRVIGLTGQYAALDPLLTGRENLELMGRLHRLGRAESRRRSEELLTRFDLLGHADRRASTFSGGTLRRLDLCAGLVGRPRLIFLDEPTTGLDPTSRRALWDVVGELVADGTTVLLTTHHLEEADALADRIAFLDDGRIMARGTPSELKQLVGSERLELAIVDADAVGRAIAALPGAIPDGDRRIAVPTDGSAAAVHRVLDQLSDEAIAVETISLSSPSLDDAFAYLSADRDAAASTAVDH